MFNQVCFLIGISSITFFGTPGMKETEVSLRTAARQESLGGGQGIFKCNCTGNCITKGCKCYKAGLKCNSRRQNQKSCTNK